MPPHQDDMPAGCFRSALAMTPAPVPHAMRSRPLCNVTRRTFLRVRRLCGRIAFPLSEDYFMQKHLVISGLVLAIGAVQSAAAAPVEVAGSGANPAELKPFVDAFLAPLGPNHQVGGSFAAGH